MRLNRIFFFLIVGLFFIVTENTQAASLYIDPGRSEIYRGDAIEMSVRLDVDQETGECVNAVDAVITYTANIAPVDVSIGDSIFSMWVERPVINTTNRTITFAGGIPNGYCGRVQGDPRLTNTLAKIIFRSPGFAIGGISEGIDEKTVKISFDEISTAYLNDGQGTQAPLRLLGAEIYLNDSAGSTGIQDPWRNNVNNDEEPPEEFSIFLEKDERAFGGKYYIAFNTTDKQTGIDQYQVMEQPLAELGSFVWGRADAPWITARSPYVLEDQSLNSIIRVKAIDKAGNEYISTLIPNDSLRTMSTQTTLTYVLLGGATVIVLILVMIGVTFFNRRTKRKELSEDTDNTNVSSGTPDENLT